MQAATLAYQAGNYAAAERLANQLVAQAQHAPTISRREAAARARQILAYTAARQLNFSLARIRFASLETDASLLPDHGSQAAEPGEIAPTLEAEAAFQHAVCTSALGQKSDAEAEYETFMRRYPDSPLVQAAALRIARMHGGDLPVNATKIWQHAEKVSVADQSAVARAQAMCAPACLAELIQRREGISGKIAFKDQMEQFAREMNTGAAGTSLADLRNSARAHGWPQAQGFALTQRGLMQQSLPVIAFVNPGHYVIVDAATPSGVQYWSTNIDPASGGSEHTVSWGSWNHYWRGVALALTPSHDSRLM